MTPRGAEERPGQRLRDGPPGDVLLARAVRNGVVEAVHRGRVAVAHPLGQVVALGDPNARIFPRSAVKPAQAAAALAVVDEHIGWDQALVDPVASLAIATSSHDGGLDHQVEAAHLLAAADLDEGALRCPAAWPSDEIALADASGRTRLAHQCSGKHALLLWAHTLLGGDPDTYLDASSPLSARVWERIRMWASEEPEGPGVDGCGAPAWTLTVAGLARMAGRAVSAGESTGQRVVQAMRARPELVGGPGRGDTRLMLAVPGMVAKRGAEGVLVVGAPGGVGVAVKITDGAARAALPVAASALSALGWPVPEDLRAVPVIGGGRPQGSVEVVADLQGLAAAFATGAGAP